MERDASNKEITTIKASLRRSIFLCFVAFFTLVSATIAWFAKNDMAHTVNSQISANGGRSDFELATVGKYLGVYDENFELDETTNLVSYGGVDYYLVNGNNSFLLSSDSNFNNLTYGKEIRPGDKGLFDLYVICKSDKRDITLKPSLTKWRDDYIETALCDNYVKSHIMFFLEQNSDGTYEKRISFDELLHLNLTDSIYQDENVEIYKITFYWIWAEEFHNLIYTGRTYNNNLFDSLTSEGYIAMNNELNTKMDDYFIIPDGAPRPVIDVNLTTDDYLFYTECYNLVDEEIGANISYLEFGIELVEGA